MITAITDAQTDTDPVQRLSALVEERRDIEAAIERAADADDEALVIRLIARQRVLPGRIERAILPALEHEIAVSAATVARMDAETATVSAELPAAQAAVAEAVAALEAARQRLAAIHGRIAVPQRERAAAIAHTRACREELERQRDPGYRASSEISGTLREGVLALIDLAGVRRTRPTALPSHRATLLASPHAEIPRRREAGSVAVAGPHEQAGELQSPRESAALPSARWRGDAPGRAEDEPLPA